MLYDAMDGLKSLLLVPLLAVGGIVTANAQKFETVVSLPDVGTGTYGALVKTPDGSFLGTASTGGSLEHGTIYRVSQGEINRLINFDGEGGSAPDGGLIAGSDGKFYGLARRGGKYDRGTVYRISAAGEFEKLADFAAIDAPPPTGELMQASDGNFYGVCSDGQSTESPGLIFKWSPSDGLSVVAKFADDGSLGRDPVGPLVEQVPGTYMGMTERGGTLDDGILFNVTADGAISRLADLAYARPEGLVRGTDGNFYGTMWNRVIKVTPAGILSTVADFDFVPFVRGPLVEKAGTFYGVTQWGGTYDAGIVFKITPSESQPAITKIADLGPEVGSMPLGGLAFGNDGCLYGTTSKTEGFSTGTVFKVTESGEISKIADLGAIMGKAFRNIVAGPDNNLFALSWSGGKVGRGTLLEIKTNGAVRKVLDFDQDSYPLNMVMGLEQELYVTIRKGAAQTTDELFRATTSGELTHLATFADIGISVPGPMIYATDRALYGVGFLEGLVFRYTPTAGLESILQEPDNRLYPGEFFEAPDGGLYGAGQSLFRVSKTGALKTIGPIREVFGGYPIGSPVLGHDGNFYGLVNRGSDRRNSVYRVSPAGKTDHLVTFKNPGAFLSGLLVGPGGDLFGTTIMGEGGEALGNVFKVSLKGEFTVLHKFRGLTDGAFPRSRLCTGPDGNLYGATANSIFRLVTSNGSPVANNDSLEMPAIRKNVIANDTDPNNDPVQIVNVTNGSHGTVSFTREGTVTYSPAPDLDFATIEVDSFTYTISDPLGETSTATVIVSVPQDIFRAGAGSYNGMLTLEGLVKGHLNLAVTKNGTFTGTVLVDGVRTPITGTFGADGSYSVTITRDAPLPPLMVTLQLDVISNAIIGTVSAGGSSYSANLSRKLNLFNVETPTPHRGRYTALISNNETGPLLPGGIGFARMSVAANGTVLLTGKLGDGTPFSVGTSFNSENNVPLFIRAYSRKQGYLAGQITFQITDAGDAAGSLTWHKPAQPNDQLYPAGFNTAPTFQATRYRRPPRLGFADLDHDATLTVGERSSTELYREGPFIFRGVNSGDRSNVKFDPETGLFRGAFFDGATRYLVEGAIYQYTPTHAAGLGFDQSGTLNVSVVPNPSP